MVINDEKYKRRAAIIKAVGHPARLAMVDALLEGEKCVCELQELVGSHISTVSKHLAVLRNAGLVSERKEGLRVYYSLRAPCMVRFLDCVEEVVNDDRATGESRRGRM